MLQLCIAQHGSGAAEPNSGVSSWSPVCSPATQMGWRTTIKSLLCEPIRSQHLLLLIGAKGLEWCLFTQNLISNLDLARRVKNEKGPDFLAHTNSILHLLMYFLRLYCSTWIVEKLKTPHGRYNRNVFYFFIFLNWFINCPGCKLFLARLWTLVTQKREDKYDFFHTQSGGDTTVQRPAGQRTHQSYCYVFSYFVNWGGHCG